MASMFLALREMRRAKVRFGLLIAAVALLVFLILFQQSLQNSLLTSFVGAIRNQSAPVLVYSVDGQRTLQGSVITPDLEALVIEADGVGAVAPLWQGTFTVTTGDGEPLDASIIGFADPALGAPDEVAQGRLPEASGEAIASTVDAADGFDVGDTVRVEPGGYEIEVVGLADDVQLNAGPTMFVTADSYAAAVAARNPDAGQAPPNVLAVAPADGATADEAAASINAQSEDLDALPRADAADSTPGVEQVRQSFNVIFLLYGLVVPLVTGLFFLIVTFQKADALTLLRAIGAPARRLVGALLVQVVVIVGLGLVVGIALYTPLTTAEIGSLALRFETTAVVVWSALLLGLSVLSAMVAARRVLAIDPIRATTGAGVR
jgi:putative ABC transport system permease protein